jgi:methylated-DNA-protein-cysteine methyltransferase-like protein
LSSPFTERVRSIIAAIPRGKVATYGQVAMLAGNPRAARQVSWILHSSSRRHKLPWHRVIGSQGRISLQPGRGYEEQRALLLSEGISFESHGRIDMERHGWRPCSGEIEKL